MGSPSRGRADFFAPGDWNIACSMCGRKRKASYMVRNWQGLYRCPEHNEPRQPQDFARGVKDIMTVPWAQLETDNFTSTPGVLPITLSSANLALQPQQLFTLSGLGLVTLDGRPLVVTQATATIASIGIVVPAWVVPRTILWQFISGGVGITLSSTSAPWITLTANSTPVSGVLQCTVSNIQGFDPEPEQNPEPFLIGSATANVSG